MNFVDLHSECEFGVVYDSLPDTTTSLKVITTLPPHEHILNIVSKN